MSLGEVIREGLGGWYWNGGGRPSSLGLTTLIGGLDLMQDGAIAAHFTEPAEGERGVAPADDALRAGLRGLSALPAPGEAEVHA